MKLNLRTFCMGFLNISKRNLTATYYVIYSNYFCLSVLIVNIIYICYNQSSDYLSFCNSRRKVCKGGISRIATFSFTRIRFRILFRTHGARFGCWRMWSQGALPTLRQRSAHRYGDPWPWQQSFTNLSHWCKYYTHFLNFNEQVESC